MLQDTKFLQKRKMIFIAKKKRIMKKRDEVKETKEEKKNISLHPQETETI